MNKPKNENLSDIKQEFLAKKASLEEQLKLLSQEKVSDTQTQDPGDQASTSTMETLNSSLQDSVRTEYEGVLQALNKIDEGTYGICSDCNLPISERRLKLNPNASRCLACQEIYEEHMQTR